MPKRVEDEVNRLDGVKQNCKLSNLELTTPKKNVQHAITTGLTKPLLGEARPNSLFSDKEVVLLRRLYSSRKISMPHIARQKKTSVGVVSLMINGKTYKHV